MSEITGWERELAELRVDAEMARRMIPDSVATWLWEITERRRTVRALLDQRRRDDA